MKTYTGRAPAVWAGSLLAGAALGLVAGCSNTELRCVSESCRAVPLAVTDNLATTKGKVCTLDPNASTYPYKIIFVIDVSKSNETSDPVHGRANAVKAALEENSQKAGVSFAIVTFSNGPTDELPGFSNDLVKLESKLPNVDQALFNTNYADTLTLVGDIITRDIASQTADDPSVVPYMQYDVQWLSDGNPEGAYGEFGQASLARKCTERETLPYIATQTDKLLTLPKVLGFRRLKISTIYQDYKNPITNLPYQSECVTLLKQPDKWATGDKYLSMMAQKGGGTFKSLTADKLSFDINIQPITHSYEQHSFFLVDYSRVVDHDRLLADSDQDGVADEAESSNKTDPLKADTSGVGCSDRVIQLYDVDNPGTCVQLCTGGVALPPGAGSAPDSQKATDDSDADTILACAESVTHGSDIKPDTDDDEIPDDIELRFGTRMDQAFKPGEDIDLDGIADLDEVRLGLDPRSPQSDRSLGFSYVPLTETTSDNPSVKCYTFEVNRVQLVETQATATFKAGENNLCLTMVEHLSDNPASQPIIVRACKQAFFQTVDGVPQKLPADGVVTFEPTDFMPVSCVGGNCGRLAPKSSAKPVTVGAGG